MTPNSFWRTTMSRAYRTRPVRINKMKPIEIEPLHSIDEMTPFGCDDGSKQSPTAWEPSEFERKMEARTERGQRAGYWLISGIQLATEAAALAECGDNGQAMTIAIRIAVRAVLRCRLIKVALLELADALRKVER
jgi:hypothetical protein